MLNKFEFGSEAIPYIESCLYQGKTLSKNILHKQRIERRKEIFAYLPVETSFEQRVRFLEGGIIREPGSTKMTAEFISEFLVQDENRCALFEHSLATPGDPWLQETNTKFISYKSEVYLFLTSQDSGLNFIQQTLSKTGSYPSIGILAILPPNTINIHNRQEIDQPILEIFASQLQYIIVGAYDEETVLFWRRD